MKLREEYVTGSIALSILLAVGGYNFVSQGILAPEARADAFTKGRFAGAKLYGDALTANPSLLTKDWKRKHLAYSMGTLRDPYTQVVENNVKALGLEGRYKDRYDTGFNEGRGCVVLGLEPGDDAQKIASVVESCSKQ